MRELRDRAKTDDTGSAFESVNAPSYTLELLTLVWDLVDVREGPSDRVEIILSFEPEPFDEFVWGFLLRRCRRTVLALRRGAGCGSRGARRWCCGRWYIDLHTEDLLHCRLIPTLW